MDSAAWFLPEISEAMGIAEPNADGELKRAVDALHAMNIEDDIFSSLDAAITVFKGRKKDSLVYVQVKRVTKQGGEHYISGICNEIRILTQLTPPHVRVSTLLDCYQTQRHVWIISEFIGGNCLRDILVHTCLGAAAIRALCNDMAQAVLFLHTQCNVVHCDLRPDNIWFTESGMVKLCGFALAHHADGKGVASETLKQHFISNAEYAPPEMLLGKAQHGYCKESDVWMFGITLYESIHGVTPFTGTSYFHVCDRVLEDQPMFSTACTTQIVHLTKLLLCKDANLRPTGTALIEAVKYI